MSNVKEKTVCTRNLIICADPRILLEEPSRNEENEGGVKIGIKIPDTVDIHTVQIGNMSYSFDKNISEYEINVYSATENNVLSMVDDESSITYQLSSNRLVHHLIIDESSETLKMTRTHDFNKYRKMLLDLDLY